MVGQPTRPEPITVGVVDDQRHARESLKAVLRTCQDMRVVGEATNGLEAIVMVREQKPEVLIVDVRMPLMNGIEAVTRIKNSNPETAVIIHTMYPHYLPDARAIQADAFVLKGEDPAEIVAAIRRLAAREESTDV